MGRGSVTCCAVSVTRLTPDFPQPLQWAAARAPAMAQGAAGDASSPAALEQAGGAQGRWATPRIAPTAGPSPCRSSVSQRPWAVDVEEDDACRIFDEEEVRGRRGVQRSSRGRLPRCTHSLALPLADMNVFSASAAVHDVGVLCVMHVRCAVMGVPIYV